MGKGLRMSAVQAMPDSATVRHMEEITVRELPKEEWDLLRQIPEVKDALPDPRVSSCIVAQEPDGTIVGYAFLYVALHIGPMELAEKYRKKPGILRKIWRGVRDVMARCGYPLGYSVIMDYNLPNVGSMAMRLGFQKIPGALYFVIPEQEKIAVSTGASDGQA